MEKHSWDVEVFTCTCKQVVQGRVWTWSRRILCCSVRISSAQLLAGTHLRPKWDAVSVCSSNLPVFNYFVFVKGNHLIEHNSLAEPITFCVAAISEWLCGFIYFEIIWLNFNYMYDLAIKNHNLVSFICIRSTPFTFHALSILIQLSFRN